MRPQVQLLRKVMVGPAASASTLSPPLGWELAPLLAQNDPSNPPSPVLPYIEAPALTTSQLPNGETLTYTLVETTDQALSNVISSAVMGVQTGAGGAGAAAAIFAARLKLAGGQYCGLKVTASSGANVAGLSLTFAIALT